MKSANKVVRGAQKKVAGRHGKEKRLRRPKYLLAIVNRLEKCHVSQTECARRCGLARKTINEIVKAKSVITPRVALLLERVLQLDARWLLREQADHQLAAARKRLESHLEKFEPYEE